jgi:hypothetical protein
MLRRLASIVVVSLALPLTAAACASPSPTPSATPTTFSEAPATVSEDEARAAFDAYSRGVQAMFDAEDADPELLKGAATAPAADRAARDVQSTLDAGFRQTVAPTIHAFVLLDGALSDSAEAALCLDASEAEIVDRSTGEPAERTTDPFTDWHVTFQRVDARLVVADYQSIAADGPSPCAS